MYKLSKRSRQELRGVHPDLVKVVKRAIKISEVDFGVNEGWRLIEHQRYLVDEGRSTTMQSKHLPQGDGYAHAVDLFVLVDGLANWEHKHFRKVIQAMFTAAIEMKIQIKAGGLWRDFLDSPHFELNAEYYND